MSKKAKVIKADNRLKQKAGYGEISEKQIQVAETVIQENKVEFKEIALQSLSELQKAILAAKSSKNMDHLVHDLTNPVMELKANGPMFKYELVGNLASVMLSFLEHIESPDGDALEIIEAHEKTLSAIVGKGMKGHGGTVGQQLVKELEDACARYYRKNPDRFKKSPRQTHQ